MTLWHWISCKWNCERSFVLSSLKGNAAMVRLSATLIRAAVECHHIAVSNVAGRYFLHSESKGYLPIDATDATECSPGCVAEIESSLWLNLQTECLAGSKVYGSGAPQNRGPAADWSYAPEANLDMHQSSLWRNAVWEAARKHAGKSANSAMEKCWYISRHWSLESDCSNPSALRCSKRAVKSLSSCAICTVAHARWWPFFLFCGVDYFKLGCLAKYRKKD